MTGDEVLNRVRYHAGDEEIGHYIEINRALRTWCQIAGLPWLKDVKAGAVIFRTSVQVYPLGDFGLRRLDRIYVQESTTDRWQPVEIWETPDFEAYQRDRIRDDNTQDTGRPRIGVLEGAIGQWSLRVSPIPDKNYDGRVDGIASTPIVLRGADLPGPGEYHEDVARLAAAYHLQYEGRQKLRNARDEGTILSAQTLIREGRGMEQEAMAVLGKATVEANQNRLVNLKPVKRKLAQ